MRIPKINRINAVSSTEYVLIEVKAVGGTWVVSLLDLCGVKTNNGQLTEGGTAFTADLEVLGVLMTKRLQGAELVMLGRFPVMGGDATSRRN